MKNRLAMYFNDYANEIKDYCIENFLSFEKAKKLSRCGGKDFLVLQHPDEDGKIGMWEPMPVVIWIRKDGDKLKFEQTEYTKRYLAMDE